MHCPYDLTKTYLAGNSKFNPKARFGRSKEKRSDCWLTTIGLVVDEAGFPKKSCFFAGNQSEPETLKQNNLSCTQTWLVIK